MIVGVRPIRILKMIAVCNLTNELQGRFSRHTAQRKQTPSEASLAGSRRDLAKTAIFVVCAPLGLKEIGSAIHSRGCVA